jgi:periplasmic protein CpxP/Spy
MLISSLKGRKMNRFKKNVVIGMTVLGFGLGGLGSAAFAAADSQAPGSGPQDKPARMHKHHKHDPAEFKARMEKRQTELHGKLKLTQNQEAAWKTYTASLTPAKHGQRPDRAEMEKLSAPERMEKMLERSKQRQDAMATRLQAVKTFYAQLTPEQQKVFNDNFAKPHRFGRGHERS